MAERLADAETADRGKRKRERLSRVGGVSLWRQIAETLEQEIRSGVWPGGERLPTESALAGRFTVNRHTVRRALGVLQQRGLVDTEQGRGSFVRHPLLDYPISRYTRFHDIIRRQHAQPAGEDLCSRSITADAELARLLGLPHGGPVILLERRGLADRHPITLATHYFNGERLPDLLDHYVSGGSISAALAACGVGDYERRWTRVRARPAEPREAQLLALNRPWPVLVTEALNVDRHGNPLEYGVTRFAADRIQIVFDATG